MGIQTWIRKIRKKREFKRAVEKGKQQKKSGTISVPTTSGTISVPTTSTIAETYTTKTITPRGGGGGGGGNGRGGGGRAPTPAPKPPQQIDITQEGNVKVGDITYHGSSVVPFSGGKTANQLQREAFIRARELGVTKRGTYYATLPIHQFKGKEN